MEQVVLSLLRAATQGCQIWQCMQSLQVSVTEDPTTIVDVFSGKLCKQQSPRCGRGSCRVLCNGHLLVYSVPEEAAPAESLGSRMLYSAISQQGGAKPMQIEEATGSSWKMLAPAGMVLKAS